MVHLHKSLFHIPHLARLMTVAGLTLTVATVVGVAQLPHSDAAYAQSVQHTGSSRQGYAAASSAGKASASSSKTGSTGGSATKNSTAKTGGTTPTPAGTKTTSGDTAAAAAKQSTTKTTTPTPKPTPKPAPAPAPAAIPTPPAGAWKYALHSGIKTTWFYAGEPASADNDYIQNVSSAWQDDWQSHFGGSDNPSSRCGYNPCGFTPHENPFYFALPFSDYTNTGPVADLSMVPWKQGPMADGTSILKNRWIQITAAPGGTSKTVYAQWEDVGPFNEHDSSYVFGTSAPASSRAGLDISPAARDYLSMGGSTTSSWRFVDYSEVPAGPWKTIITTSGPDWH